MFTGLTAKAQRVINQYAQEEARRLNFDKIEPESIFLGLIREPESVAVKVLQKLNTDIDKIKFEIENFAKPSNNTMVMGDLQPSQRVQKILTLSAEEAKTLNHHYIGTEHLLLGIYREEDGIVFNLLESYNLTLSLLRKVTVEMLGFGVIPKSTSTEKVKKTPTLDSFGRDLSILAKDNNLDPVIGRHDEITRLIQILSRRTKNNPILIGEPGVGKSAIAEGLALRIHSKEVPDILLQKRVVILDLAACVAGTKYRGEFEERIKNIMLEVKRSQNVILFIDEVHTMIGTGGAEGAMDAANILKPALSRGELQCIGSTTIKEYKKYIEKDTALVRRFQPIMINEPSIDDTIAILTGLKPKYEEYHNVVYTPDAITYAAVMAKRYLTQRFLPDTAIDCIDEAGAKARINNSNTPAHIKAIEAEIENLNKEKNNVVKNQEFEKAAVVRDEIANKKEQLAIEIEKWQKMIKKQAAQITSEDICEVVSKATGIPLSKIAEEESAKLVKLEESINQRIIGQEDAVKAVARAVRRSRTGLKNRKRPAGSFIFLGPTGVGKTELAKVLAQFLFGTEDALIRIDMSEFMEKHTGSRLIGAPPGFIGYEEGGELTDKVRRKPYSVILFDEIEKAHPDIYNLLLQILEDGRLTDNLGHRVDFSNTILILTSNLGGKEIVKGSALGFGSNNQNMNVNDIRNIALDELKKQFNPEFLNRIDETVVFNPLTKKNIEDILDIQLMETTENLKSRNISISLDDEAKKFLVEKGYNKNYGARPLRRIIQTDLEDMLAEKLLRKEISDNTILRIGIQNSVLTAVPV